MNRKGPPKIEASREALAGSGVNYFHPDRRAGLDLAFSTLQANRNVYPNGADTTEAMRDAGLLEAALFAALKKKPGQRIRDDNAVQALNYLQTLNLVDCFLSPDASSTASPELTKEQQKKQQKQRNIAWRTAYNLAAAAGGFDVLKRISRAPENGFNEKTSLNLRLCLQACAAIREHAGEHMLYSQPQTFSEFAESEIGQSGPPSLAIKALDAAVHHLRAAASGEAAEPHDNDWALRALRNGFSSDGGPDFTQAAKRYYKMTRVWVRRANGTQAPGDTQWWKRLSPLHRKSPMNTLAGPNGFRIAGQGRIGDLKVMGGAMAELEKGLKERIESDLVAASPDELPDHVVENALRVCILQHWQAALGWTQRFRRRKLRVDNLEGSITKKMKMLELALLPQRPNAFLGHPQFNKLLNNHLAETIQPERLTAWSQDAGWRAGVALPSSAQQPYDPQAFTTAMERVTGVVKPIDIGKNLSGDELAAVLKAGLEEMELGSVVTAVNGGIVGAGTKNINISSYIPVAAILTGPLVGADLQRTARIQYGIATPGVFLEASSNRGTYGYVGAIVLAIASLPARLMSASASGALELSATDERTQSNGLTVRRIRLHNGIGKEHVTKKELEGDIGHMFESNPQADSDPDGKPVDGKSLLKRFLGNSDSSLSVFSRSYGRAIRFALTASGKVGAAIGIHRAGIAIGAGPEVKLTEIRHEDRTGYLRIESTSRESTLKLKAAAGAGYTLGLELESDIYANAAALPLSVSADFFHAGGKDKFTLMYIDGKLEKRSFRVLVSERISAGVKGIVDNPAPWIDEKWISVEKPRIEAVVVERAQAQARAAARAAYLPDSPLTDAALDKALGAAADAEKTFLAKAKENGKTESELNANQAAVRAFVEASGDAGDGAATAAQAAIEAHANYLNAAKNSVTEALKDQARKKIAIELRDYLQSSSEEASVNDNFQQYLELKPDVTDAGNALLDAAMMHKKAHNTDKVKELLQQFYLLMNDLESWKPSFLLVNTIKSERTHLTNKIFINMGIGLREYNARTTSTHKSILAQVIDTTLDDDEINIWIDELIPRDSTLDGLTRQVSARVPPRERPERLEEEHVEMAHITIVDNLPLDTRRNSSMPVQPTPASPMDNTLPAELAKLLYAKDAENAEEESQDYEIEDYEREDYELEDYKERVKKRAEEKEKH
ncbi:MAG: hypothetical protein A3I66_21135 [Burkholderiales bacterium RIFCSPLOWO2_02_FULL_57_36]|nr:MAG: hypothetical protein A3I66_21135 [Burkholderiales bacterium RIFCSPLOWO2_02_FULL_57_36]